MPEGNNRPSKGMNRTPADWKVLREQGFAQHARFTLHMAENPNMYKISSLFHNKAELVDVKDQLEFDRLKEKYRALDAVYEACCERFFSIIFTHEKMYGERSRTENELLERAGQLEADEEAYDKLKERYQSTTRMLIKNWLNCESDITALIMSSIPVHVWNERMELFDRIMYEIDEGYTKKQNPMRILREFCYNFWESIELSNMKRTSIKMYSADKFITLQKRIGDKLKASNDMWEDEEKKTEPKKEEKEEEKEEPETEEKETEEIPEEIEQLDLTKLADKNTEKLEEKYTPTEADAKDEIGRIT